ncbi:MAG: TraB/GumN family protein [Ignavibacteria bacterium]|nr:TraB/GumN family protein [Ignavibacteria bacterium]
MKKSIILLLFVLFVLNTKAQEERKYFFWEMSDAKSRNVTYLLGSIHLGNSKLFPLPDKIESAFDRSSVLVLELDLNSIDPFQLANRAMYLDGRTLEEALSPKTYRMLINKLEENGITEDIANFFKPWFAAMIASISYYEGEGLSTEYGIETYFLKKANEKGKTLAELESIDEQVNVFDALPDSLNDLVVDYILSGVAGGTEFDTEKLIDSYISGNEKELSSYLFNNENPSEIELLFQNRLLIDRNIKMSQKIEEYHKSNTIHFVIAGTAHFLGPNGIIEILNKKGYRIKRF